MESRARAHELIAAGRVTVAGAVVDKPARLVAPNEPLVVRGPPDRYVSRAGAKLEGALTTFAVPVEGRRALDAGASTGGFTDCLLQHGAARVVAVDVGYGQLHERVRTDPRVENHERTNIRMVAPGQFGDAFELVVADLSFISLRTVAQPLLALLADAGDLVTLVKPQFEAGRAEADRGRGVIRDPDVWTRVLGEVACTFEDLGGVIMGGMVSPVAGAEGNVEFLLHVRKTASSVVPFDAGAVVATVQPSTPSEDVQD